MCHVNSSRDTRRRRERAREKGRRVVERQTQVGTGKERRKSSRHIFAQRKIVEGTCTVKHAYVGLINFRNANKTVFDRFSLPYARGERELP